MRGNPKSLKRNDEECTGILIAPSKLPRTSSIFEILTLNFSYPLPATDVGFGPKIRGADGEPTIDRRKSALEDVAVLTGGNVRLAKMNPSHMTNLT